MKGRDFWEGYQICLEDCQKVVKQKSKKHGDTPYLYYECIDNHLKAGLVLMNEKWCRLQHKINSGSTDTAAMREDCRDLINYTAFLYSKIREIAISDSLAYTPKEMKKMDKEG